MENCFEIERKFLVKQLPKNLNNYKKETILQGYISTSLRYKNKKKENLHFLTFKDKGSIKKLELEQEITEKEFKNLWEKIENNPILKTRYKIPLKDNVIAELDIYEGL